MYSALRAPTSSSCGGLVAFCHLEGPSGPPNPTPLPPGNSRGTLGKCKKCQQIICLKPLYGELPKICDWIRKYVQIYHNF